MIGGMVSQLCALAMLAGSAAPGADGSDPRAWLERMGHAVENLSYEGTFVHIIRGSTAETMRIVHRVTDGHISERLISLDGSGREIIRNGDEVRCVFENDKSVVVDKREQSPLLASLPSYNEQLDHYYDFLVLRRDRVVDRDARVIEVRPRDEFRYGHRLWLDEQTALPLRTALIDKGGAIMEQVLFTSISFDRAIPDEELRPALAAGEGYRWFVGEAEPERRTQSEEASWQAEDLPRGFRMTVARAGNADQPSEVEHYVYTDGLASVSVFVEQPQSDLAPLNGLSTIGSANAYATMIDGYQVMAVGEVPPSTVEMIGASLRRRK